MTYRNVAWHERNRRSEKGRALIEEAAKQGRFHYMMADAGIRELINYEPKLIGYLVKRASLLQSELEKAIPEGPGGGSIRSSFYQRPAPGKGFKNNRYAQILENIDEGFPGYNKARGDLVKKIMRRIGK